MADMLSETALMSIAEIEALYPDHVILIDQPVLDDHKRLIGGTVVFAGQEKKEVHQMMGELKLVRCAIHWTKKDPPDRKYM